MAKVSITQAAKLAGVSRTTLYNRHIKTGAITVEMDGAGNKLVDTSEILRVFGRLLGGEQLEQAAPVHDGQSFTPENTAVLQAKIAALEAENRQLLERITDKDTHLADMRQTIQLLEYKKTGRRWWPF